MHKKKSVNKAFFCKKNKENTEQSVHNTIELQDYHSVFQNNNNPTTPKIIGRIQQFERQTIFYKEKIAEQASLIAKLESKEVLLRKKFS